MSEIQILIVSHMTYNNFSTYNEILEQPDVFKRIISNMERNITPIAKKFLEEDINTVVLVGCGTSYYATIPASTLFNLLTDIKSFTLPSSEMVSFNFRSFYNKTAAICLSRSGETTETVLANKKAKKLGLLTIGITNNPDSTLAKETDYSIYIEAGKEKSIIMTKTFSSLVLVSMLIAIKVASLQGDPIGNKLLSEIHRISDIASNLLLRENDKIRKIAEDFTNYDHFVILGSGLNYGIALEGALKIKETNYIATEAFSTLEFRHGPMAMVDEKLVVIGLIPQSERLQDEILVLKEISEKGGKVLLITNAKIKSEINGLVVNFPLIHEYLTPIINIIPVQLLAFYMCVNRGYNPDKPRHITRVVKLREKN